MQQKSLLTTFWFWLFIIGLALVLTALIIGGGIKKITGWIWAIFIIGVALAILGIIFAIFQWMIPESCDHVNDHVNDHVKEDNKMSLSYEETINSPIKSPTRLHVNVPQAERGFTTTSSDLSSLAMNSN